MPTQSAGYVAAKRNSSGPSWHVTKVTGVAKPTLAAQACACSMHFVLDTLELRLQMP
ncbi:hypothetical protein [Burkholderia sp. TSV86]|uniref:hypothetical protein n=1 Tax=Burkholderia sp. TSV86 TaxID=1385594 RepID=UPI001E449A91|nr:hypothetical protein [Burkholderia sp. TSV86]